MIMPEAPWCYITDSRPFPFIIPITPHQHSDIIETRHIQGVIHAYTIIFLEYWNETRPVLIVNHACALLIDS